MSGFSWVAAQLFFSLVRFGFVDFESDEVCKEAKKAMEDCQIDGCNVSVAYARAKVERNRSAAADQSTTGDVWGLPGSHYVSLRTFFLLTLVYF